MVNFFNKAALLAVAVAPLVTAQTSSSCDPTKKTCPADPGLNQASYTVDFTKGKPSDWTMTFQDIAIDPNNGAVFTVNGYDDAPTIQSNWYLFFGKVECTVQAAPGAGIISSFILISDDLDEIDWEVVGSDTTHIQSNYFGKGNTTTYDRGAYNNVNSPASTFHTYGIDWNSDKTQWLIDGQVVRTLNYGDAVGGQNYPQTPMQIRLGNWVGGRPQNPPGTVTWAGGVADLSKAPFNFFVKSCTVTNYNPASSYTYGDNSGSFGSIQKAGGGSVGGQPSQSQQQNSPSTTSTTTAPTTTSTKTSTSTPTTTSTSTTSSATTLTSVVSLTTDTAVTSQITSVPAAISSTVTEGVTGSDSTVSGYTPTTNTFTPPSSTSSSAAQVTSNAAPGTFEKSSALGLGLAMGLALML